MFCTDLPDGVVVRGDGGVSFDAVALDDRGNSGTDDPPDHRRAMGMGDDAVDAPTLQLRQGSVPSTRFPIEGPRPIEIGVLCDTKLQLSPVLPRSLQQQDDPGRRWHEIIISFLRLCRQAQTVRCCAKWRNNVPVVAFRGRRRVANIPIGAAELVRSGPINEW